MNINLEYPLYPFYERNKNFQGEFKNWDQIDNMRYFIMNRDKFGDEWRYTHKKIWHSYNSLGYRTKELDYYKDKDFVLVLGCSHTEGNGLADDEVWHYQLKEKLKMEVLNAGISACGPDVMLLNTLLFLKNSNLRPKAVAIQWPNPYRYTWKGDTAMYPLVPINTAFPAPPHDDNSDLTGFQLKVIYDLYRLYLFDEQGGNNSKIFVETTRMLWKLAGIPLHEFTIDEECLIDGVDQYWPLLIKDHFARDLQHYGHLSHQAIGEKVCDKLKSML